MVARGEGRPISFGWLFRIQATPANADGLVGMIGQGEVTGCYSMAGVNGIHGVGGLVGENHRGEDYSLCDIGTSPLGDGIVDVQDLIVFAEHLFEEIPPVE